MDGLRKLGKIWIGAALCLAAPAGCHLFPLASLHQEKIEHDAAPGTPSKFSNRVSQFVFLSDFELSRNLPLFRELGNLREQVYKELQLPPSNNIVQVYVFEDRDRYERFMKMKYPELPKRRAFFVAQPRRLGGTEDLLVYTYWGDKIHQDLRHELTHALLHSGLKDVPLWLDEGLAEYFEMPPAWNGVNYHHLEQLRLGDGFQKLDLARLEQLKEVHQMSHVEYREAWAWVHLMLRSTPQARQVLISYLHELRTNPRPTPLQPRLNNVYPTLASTLERHLTDLDLNRLQPASAQR
jgi:hypothetical protein